jgi:hypothetical protein
MEEWKNGCVDGNNKTKGSKKTSNHPAFQPSKTKNNQQPRLRKAAAGRASNQ